ncbi:YwgA family protein [Sporolactobacillus kofuensis]|uniref:YwgA family protein n=1 Tax=Sporolactobacillus kofuensis TaxID=269672 RepID=A0ABW1WIG0_9BACL|nr:hypothetical protein [Sporolactobacillus kofuensis]MCO7176291.1 hypothetical protein [Sporolactobacillus kofuensis]
MLEDHAKIASLIRQAGEISGGKKLQRIVYILQKLGYPFKQIFHFHFSGPYSEELSVQLEELCDFGFLVETREEKGEEERFRYRLSEAGEGFLSHYKNVLPDMKNLTQKLIDQNAQFLECVALLLYFDHLPHREAIEKIKSIEQKPIGSDLDCATLFIEEIRILRSIDYPVIR